MTDTQPTGTQPVSGPTFDLEKRVSDELREGWPVDNTALSGAGR